MWGSSLVGDTYDIPDMIANLENDEVREICKELIQHPIYKEQARGLIQIVINLQGKEEKEHKNDKDIKTASFPMNGDGWFEYHLGTSADGLVKRLKKSRRIHKDVKQDIDEVINSIRTLKALEVQRTLELIPWAIDKEDTIRALGLSDKNLKSLRKFNESRKISLLRACEVWDNAEKALKMLDEHEDVWGDEERNAWVSSMKQREDARKQWNIALHPSDTLRKRQIEQLEFVKAQLKEHGSMNCRELTGNMIEKGLDKSISPSGLAKILKMYGEDYDIYKGSQRNMYVLLDQEGFVIKDSWAYAAGFLDADGYIMITKRGEPRAGFVATGKRGRIHCEQLHKTLDCGVLQLDQKVYKDSQRSQHRISFYSKDDLKKLLQGVMPHLKIKKRQAEAVLEYLDADSKRKSDLQKFVQYSNWSDSDKGDELLSEWNMNVEEIDKLGVIV